MTARIELPPGCYGTEMADGTKYTGKPGTSIEVEDHHASAIATSRHAGIGLLSATRSYRLATKKGRHCPECGFSAQCWSLTCPRCGTGTRPDSFQNEGDQDRSLLEI